MWPATRSPWPTTPPPSATASPTRPPSSISIPPPATSSPALIAFVIRNQQVNADDLAKAILYYRTKPKGGQLDETEEAYYQALDHPYSVKYAPFDSVEELLMVRGVTGQILFGEDWNRNGVLDANENDGDNLFPPDNSDGQLERGLYPYLTVWSSEPNTNQLQ